ncbi:AAA family ATPase [bacterium]|nr:AAA family ATPase [bacterium]
MKCQRCGKKEARVKITRIVNGQVKTEYLCEDCAAEIRGNNGFDFGFDFSDLFSNFFGDSFGGSFGSPSRKEEYDIEGFFSERLKEVLERAKKIAGNNGQTQADTEHLLLAVLEDKVAQRILSKIVDQKKLKEEIKGFIKKHRGKGRKEVVELAPRSTRVLELAYKEAYDLGHSYVGPEHLLLALGREKEGVAGQILSDLGVSYEKILRRVRSLIGEGEHKEAVKSPTPSLDEFSRDLTQEAKEGKLDPVIGREKEIETTIEILSRRTKNNPVLIGEPGVGKTAIVEGLATKIAKGEVPPTLQGKRVVALDVSAILAGTQYRGQFEERMKKIIEEIRANSDSLIIFIDELHMIVGAGAAGESGAIDAANMLKPALARGELHLIGATTLDEYRKYIEKDAALERRLQPILVPEPSVGETIEILKGLREKYEAHHKVKITDSALVAAAELSDRYISNRFLPDKAIDLLDQASARTRLKMTIEPEKIRKLDKQIKDLEREKDQAVSAQDFREAARLKKEVQELRAKKQKLEKKHNLDQASGYPVVTAEEIAEVISRATGIPVSRLRESEKKKLLNLEEKIHQRLVDQKEAVQAVANAIRRARVGLKDRRRPIGSFLFLGPTGVGKTELARTLAEVLFDNEEALIHLDMSEYMEKHAVSRLIGAPPGYVGYEEGGQLTEQVRRKPYSVVLFDEIEKAHPEVFNILLQVLDSGQLTDGQGRKVDFKNTLIILTSNIGSDLIKTQTEKEVAAKTEAEKKRVFAETKTKIDKILTNYFRPEFINRLDEIILFHPLGKKEILEIVDLQLETTKRILKGQRIELEISRAAKKYLAEKGYDSTFGARPLRRLIQTEIENHLAEELLRGKFKKGDKIKVDLKKGVLIFKKSK